MTEDDARKLALALPETAEQDHHGRPSFRVRKRIFATLREPGYMNVMLDEPGILTVVAEHPSVCSEVYWGKRLAAARVWLERADRDLLSELLADAWEGKAPPSLTDPGPAARRPTVDP